VSVEVTYRNISSLLREQTGYRSSPVSGAGALSLPSGKPGDSATVARCDVPSRDRLRKNVPGGKEAQTAEDTQL